MGFVVLDTFLSQNELGETSYDNKYKAEILKTEINDEKVIFIKPMEFMNRSG
ncbi:aminoacyl-tRNA hydrolase [Patescibacteria group bacterium]|nr:aminoacyl-tRNA hydrolase [Patescibacteria group bacterium]MBU1758205.1 aminoacyl-tRNA hydrolase [Patescibacteria group bacterium]